MNPIVSLLRRVTPILPRLTVVLVTASFAAVCAAAEPSPTVSANPPGLVDQPLVPPANDTPGAQPSPQHVWISGHWHWGQGSYVWVAGHWEIPPAPAASWVAPQWQPQGNAFFLREGYWQQTSSTTPTQVVVTPPPPPTQVIVVPPTPPPPRPEVIYTRPSRFDIWVPGYWSWRYGRYVWVPGHWDRPPRGHHRWEPAHWERRGGISVFIEGHWR